MNEMRENFDNQEIEIDLGRLLIEFKNKWKFILGVTVICVVIAFIMTNFFMTKKYESSADIYLKANTTTSGVIDSNELTTNSKMVNNYMAIIQGDTVLDLVLDDLKLEDKSVKFLKNSLKVTNTTDTEIINIKATTDDPQLSKDIVDSTVNEFFGYVKEQLDVKNLMILNQAKVATAPVSPSLPKNLVLGGMIGIVLSCGIVSLRFLLDKRLRTKEEVETFLEIPVLVEIPFIEE